MLYWLPSNVKSTSSLCIVFHVDCNTFAGFRNFLSPLYISLFAVYRLPCSPSDISSVKWLSKHSFLRLYSSRPPLRLSSSARRALERGLWSPLEFSLVRQLFSSLTCRSVGQSVGYSSSFSASVLNTFQPEKARRASLAFALIFLSKLHARFI